MESDRLVGENVFRLGRRRFLTLGVLGAGASLLASPLSVSAADEDRCTPDKPKAEVLLLSCIDYRLTEKTTRYMAERKLDGNYDHVILAGASVGVLQTKHKAWGDTFRDHVKVAVALHCINRVMVLDHRDCGAYGEFVERGLAQNPPRETQVHTKQLKELRNKMKKWYPKLQVELLLMDLEGKVETIA